MFIPLPTLIDKKSSTEGVQNPTPSIGDPATILEHGCLVNIREDHTMDSGASEIPGHSFAPPTLFVSVSETVSS